MSLVGDAHSIPEKRYIVSLVGDAHSIPGKRYIVSLVGDDQHVPNHFQHFHSNSYRIFFFVAVNQFGYRFGIITVLCTNIAFERTETKIT